MIYKAAPDVQGSTSLARGVLCYDDVSSLRLAWRVDQVRVFVPKQRLEAYRQSEHAEMGRISRWSFSNPVKSLEMLHRNEVGNSDQHETFEVGMQVPHQVRATINLCDLNLVA